MKKAQQTTKMERSVVVEKIENCNLGQTRYNLASALSGATGYSLTEDFKNTIRLLPESYSVSEYTRFLDNWGTVSFRKYRGLGSI